MSEKPLGYGCKGCGRVAKTERDLLAQGCEGMHEPLVFQATLHTCQERERVLREALERVAEKLEGDPRNQEPEAVARFIRRALAQEKVSDG